MLRAGPLPAALAGDGIALSKLLRSAPHTAHDLIHMVLLL
jgi:hypothetical protein